MVLHQVHIERVAAQVPLLGQVNHIVYPPDIEAAFEVVDAVASACGGFAENCAEIVRLRLFEAVAQLFQAQSALLGELFEEGARLGEAELVVVELFGDLAGALFRPWGKLAQNLDVVGGQPNELLPQIQVLLIDPIVLTQFCHGVSPPLGVRKY
jgi:hypothetical protein